MKLSKFVSLLLLLLLIPMQISCLGLGWTKYGPYHRPAFIYTPNFVYNTNEGRYCIINNTLYELVDGTFRELDITFNQKNESGSTDYLRNINIYDNNIYSQTSYYIYVYSFKWELKEKLNISSRSFVVCDNAIYYTKGNEPNFKLFRYDLITKETIEIYVSDDHIIEYMNTKLFINVNGDLYDISQQNEYIFNAKRYNYTWVQNKRMNFVSNNIEYLFKFEENIMKVSANDFTNSYDIKDSNMYYQKILVKEENVYFSTYEYIENPDCVEDTKCICHFGKSYIWCFNTKTKELELLKEFDVGSYIIDFNDKTYCYYFDGNVLYNDSLISNIVKVEPKGSYYCIGEPSYKVGDEYSKTYIYYDSKLYHYRIENEFDD